MAPDTVSVLKCSGEFNFKPRGRKSPLYPGNIETMSAASAVLPPKKTPAPRPQRWYCREAREAPGLRTAPQCRNAVPWDAVLLSGRQRSQSSLFLEDALNTVPGGVA